MSAEAKFCKFCAFDLTQKVPAANAYKSPVTSFTSLSEKYPTMSDSELITLLRDDLSVYTEKELSLALAELEKRNSINWLTRDILKKRVQEAITPPNEDKFSPTSISRYSESKEKAGKLINSGAITAGVSALLFLWGHNYTNNFANTARAGLSALAGQTDSSYRFAQLCVFFGVIGFIAGVTLLIVGYIRRSS